MKDSDSLEVEETDLEILQILSEDGRKSYRNLAQELNKSPVTIKKHIEDLEARDIIKGYGVQIDYEKLGYDIIAFIEVTISKGKMLEVERGIAQHPNVYGVYDITGTSDALILARFKNRLELSRMIKSIHTSEFVKRTSTHLVLNVIKEGASLSELMKSI